MTIFPQVIKENEPAMGAGYDNPERIVVQTASALDFPVVGVDVSAYQGAMDFNVTKTRAQFAYLRAGYGNDTIDSSYYTYRDGVSKAGMVWGIYWAVKPDRDWRKHAATFRSVYANDGGKLPPVLDVELDSGLGKPALEAWLYKLTHQFEQDTGQELMIYTSAGFWNAHLPMTNWAKNRKLWIAHYTGAAAPLMPDEWVKINNPRTWSLWQWSAGGNGQGKAYGAYSKDIDLNRFNGSVVEFNQIFGVSIAPLPGGEPPVEPPPPAGEPVKSFVVTSAYRNIRAAHNTTGAVVGNFQRNSVVPYLPSEMVEDWCKLGAWWVWKAANE